MPIYEYRCAACDRKASIFFRSISTVDPDPACPHCGARQLTRRMSRVWSRRGADSQRGLNEPSYEEDGVPFYGPDQYDDPFGGGGPFGGGLDGSEGDDRGTEDVAAMAREARAMAQMMGEPLDAGLDEALRHVEHGADPDDVFGELDATDSVSESATNDDP